MVGHSSLKSDYIKDWLSDKIEGLPFTHHHTIHAWSRALGHEFFAPEPVQEDDAQDHLKYSYAIAAKAEAGAESEHFQENRAKKASGVKQVLTACREDDMPYPVMVGAVAVPTEDRQFRPFEFTPQYAGVPATMQTVDGTEKKLGGAFVEPIGVNSSLPNKAKLPAPNGPPALVKLDRQWNVPVVQAAGISSSFIAAGAPTEHLLSLSEHPELVTFASDGVDSQSTGKMGFADGGGVDNLGVHAALRRNVKKLLVCVASAEDPSLQAMDGTLGKAYDVSGLFGACTDDVQMGRDPGREWGDSLKHYIKKKDWNESLLVFKDGEEKFKEMMAELKDGATKKIEVFEDGHKVTKIRFEMQPISCRLKLKVKPNPTQGINGNYEADVLFLFNSMPSDWRRKLPEATQKVVDGGIDGLNVSSVGSTWTFPYVSTYELEWSQKLVGLSSNLCAYNMKKVREDARYRDFFQFADLKTRTAAAAGLDGEPAATRMRRMPDDV